MTAISTAVGTTGVNVAKEKSLAASTSDARIDLEISNLWFKYNVDMFNALSINSQEGKVLLTGTVPVAEWRIEAARLAWQVDGVKEVINQIKIGSGAGLKSSAADTWITMQLRAQMMADNHVVSINYTIDTVDGHVYLMGIAQDQDELNRAAFIARRIEGVRQVYSYVRLKNQTDRA